MTVTTWGWFSCATARASRRNRSSWSGSLEMSRCISLIATRRSSVGSKARYTLDIPPEPIFSSSRKRSPMSVPITVIYFALSIVRPRSLLHRSGLLGLLGGGTAPEEPAGGVRRGCADHLRDGRARPRIQRRPVLARDRMARRGRPLENAARPPSVARGPTSLDLPGLHGGQGGGRAGPRRGGPPPARPAGGNHVQATAARLHGGARRGGPSREPGHPALPDRPRVERDRGGVRSGSRGDALGSRRGSRARTCPGGRSRLEGRAPRSPGDPLRRRGRRRVARGRPFL